MQSPCYRDKGRYVLGKERSLRKESNNTNKNDRYCNLLQDMLTLFYNTG